MMRRRDLLRLLTMLGGGALTVRTAFAQPGRSTFTAPPPARTIASTWQDKSALALSAQSIDETREVVSEIYRVPHLFMAVGAQWPAGVQGLAVRVRGDNGEWSDWLTVGDHESHVGRDDASSSERRGLLITPLSRYLQYRYRLQPGQPAIAVPLVIIDSTDGPTAPLQAEDPTVTASGFAPTAAQPQPVISRQQWGADESLRFSSSGAEIWPREYRVVQKGVVHHTDTSNGDSDPAAIVRAIYYYHAVSLKWGDIGYNYLIDWRGNIYEGRYGGTNVVGGHALGYNYGSVGIGCIGTFTSGGNAVTTEMRRAVARLLAWTCRSLDPHGNNYFIDGFYPNLGGHRDYNTTSCPGDVLYGLLPGLRGDVLWNLDNQRPQPAGQITGVQFQPTAFLYSGGSFSRDLTVAVTVKNVGTGLMITQGPGAGTLYNENETFRSRGYSEIPGAWRVGIEVSPPGSSLGVDHPYRWGFPDALEPGQSVTITGTIRLTQAQSRTAWAGLVQENVAWTTSQAGTTQIAIAPVRARVYLPGVTR